jgi:small membrane protein
MIISTILFLLLAAAFLAGLLMRRHAPLVGLALMAAAGVGAVLVWVPDELTRLAHLLGVGRGTDLLLYGWVMVSFLVIAGLALALRHLHAQLTRLAREFALLRADLESPERRSIEPRG